MESWLQEFSEMMQMLVEGVEQLVTDVTKQMDQAIDSFIDTSEEIAQQVQTTFELDIEPHLNEFFDPILEAYLGFEIAVEETSQPFTHTVEPMLNDHVVCIGCRNYHGQAYNGVMLVCGMHPSGWEDEKCPDWQSTWQE
jgi:hypothetical protein